ncbi:hypothetical protein LZ32DRAFT_605452 [Colletotrichum eremochloae]|nr:hypothetical protein LZ32DRAFT_605452 [Colletotrichum eremochloae]
MPQTISPILLAVLPFPSGPARTTTTESDKGAVLQSTLHGGREAADGYPSFTRSLGCNGSEALTAKVSSCSSRCFEACVQESWLISVLANAARAEGSGSCHLNLTST